MNLFKHYQIGIVGSHGYRASYGGWDPLVNHLVDMGSAHTTMLVFNDKSTPVTSSPSNVRIFQIPLKANGLQGMLYDFVSIAIGAVRCRSLLLLGVQGIPLALVLRSCFNRQLRIIANPGGVEWERPKFGSFARGYLKVVFDWSIRYADVVILDNPFYAKFVDKSHLTDTRISCIPYGGSISSQLKDLNEVRRLYNIPFKDYFLSVSRALEDNKLEQLCETFESLPDRNLVLVSNFTSSEYGLDVYHRFRNVKNICLINGIYDRSELDSLRLGCFAYIHTHTLCGSAPSLIEMIVSRKPIFSIDNPQNRFTAGDCANYFEDFANLRTMIETGDRPGVPSDELISRYRWENVVERYISLCS